MPADWQTQLGQAFRDAESLLRYLQLDAGELGYSWQAARQFPLLVPRPWAQRIHKGRTDDPLLRQVFPCHAEQASVPGFTVDPLRERDTIAGAGLLQKYHGRLLLIVTAACAIHCRYCFRRHFPYQQARFTMPQIHAVAQRIRAHPDISELILSGGDPLSLSDEALHRLCLSLGSLPQIKRLRLHTRLPIAVPDRVTSALLDTLKKIPARVVLIVHVNHANEIDAAVAQALTRLHWSGTSLLNQSVLLAGVNDCPETLAELSETLFRHHVLPYYLHQLDPVAGSAHFEVDIPRSAWLIRQLRTQLPGYLVPRLVKETPGAAYKLPLPDQAW